MSYDDNGAPIRRRTHLTYEVEELRYLALELETDHDAYVSRGRAPWRGLSGPPRRARNRASPGASGKGCRAR